ncbi:MAG TPA: hypothetical protein VIV60_06900, partial [Polyangiaceae bacterium]
MATIASARRIMGLGDSQTAGAGLTLTGAYAYWLNSFCKARNLWWVGRQRLYVPEGWFPCEGYGGYSINNGGSGQLVNIVDGALSSCDP